MASLAMSTAGIALAARARIESALMTGKAAAGELDDIDELVRVHQARIRRFAAYTTGDPDLAESIAQDTLMRAYRGRENFRGDCSLTTWLTGIAINVTRDHLRSARFKFWKQVQAHGIDAQEMASCLPAHSTSPERALLARERVRQLWKVLETLSLRQRTVFVMKFSQEMSVEEIGKALQMPMNTVRTHLHRALKAVRERMGTEI